MPKMALFDSAINEKCCSVDGGRGICPLFSSPPRGFDSSKVPTPGNLPSKAKNNFCLLGGHFIDFENINLFICVFIQLKFTKL